MLPANAGKPDNVIAEGAIQSMTDFGQPGYGGPCPPSGDKPHRYIFTVYALKVDQLPLKKGCVGRHGGLLPQSAGTGEGFTHGTLRPLKAREVKEVN